MDVTSLTRRSMLGALGCGVAAPALIGCGVAAPLDSDLVITEIKSFVMDDGFFVKITADNGVSGWGETDAGRPSLFQTYLHDAMAKRVLGRDPFDTSPILENIFYREHDFGPGGALANTLAGIDIALWDLKARVLEVPIYKLLGGQYRDKMPIYGSYGTKRWTRMTPEQAADKAEKFADRGFRTVKCRMQVRESHLDPVEDRTIEYLRTIKNRLRGTDVELFTDINNGYSVARAIQIGRVLQDELGFRFFEEPCSDQHHKHTAEVVDALDLAIIAGEKEYTPFQLQELITYANPDYINPDVIKAMGITGMHKIGVLSQVNQKPIIMHNTRPVISTAASLQLAASYPIIGPFMEFVDVDDHADMIDAADEYLTYKDGHLLIPSTPGLGIEINEEKITERSSSIRVAEFDD
ncbi:MAG: mandelate racemase/muconate lactonizing enzyme family protein [Pseudomonadota bacterium]